MTKTLVVVESPAKAKTIEKYLGDGFAVRASYGHIRDLPRSKLGVDPDQDFAVQYEVPEDSKRHVADLKKALKQNEDLVLATAYDREGEAIAFHVATLLGVEPADDRHGAVRRPGGPPDPRPLGRLQDLAAPVEAGPARTVRGPRAVGRRAA